MIVHGTQMMEQLDLGRVRLTPQTDAIWYRSTYKESKPVYYNGHECNVIKPGDWYLGSKRYVDFLKNGAESPFKGKNCIEVAEPTPPKSDPFEMVGENEPETKKVEQKGEFIEWPPGLPNISNGWGTTELVALATAMPDFNNGAFGLAHVATKAKMLREYCEKNGIQPGSFPKVKRQMHGGIM